MRLPALSAAFVVGVLLGTELGGSAWAMALFLVAAALLLPLAVSLRWRLLPVLMAPALVAGMLRVAIDEGDVTHSLDRFHGKSGLVVEGVVEGDPSAAGRATSLRLEVKRVLVDGEDPNWVEANGVARVLVSETSDIAQAREKPFFRYGDRLSLAGELTPPPEFEEFDYPAFLARQGIGTVMTFPRAMLLNEGEGSAFYRGLYSLRHRLSDSLGRAVPEPQASFAQAVLLGIRDNLPDDLVADFRQSGTSHLLAISGLHVGVLLGISLSVSAAVIGRRRQLYLLGPLIVVVAYTMVSGAPLSAIRAAIMGIAYLGALAVGRPRSVLPSLSLAASVMVAAEPRLLSDVSFQLSFAAMAGIALWSTPLAERAESALRLPAARGGVTPAVTRLLIESATVTISATAATLPLVAFYFQRVSLVGLPSTMLTMPVLPFALVDSAAAAAIGLASDVAAQPFGWLAWATSAYITGVASAVGRIPGASVETGRLAPFLVWAYYAAIVAIVFRGPIRRVAISSWSAVRTWERTWMNRSPSVPWPVVALTFAAAWLLWTAAMALPGGELSVVFADVGQGDMTVITTPRGHRIVVDGGPDPALAARAMSAALPFWARSIDLAVLTHPHGDHVTGLTKVLERYRVKRVLEREFPYDSPQYVDWRRAVGRESPVELVARPGLTLTFDDNVIIQVLGPPEKLLRDTDSDIDNASVVLRVAYGEVSFLLAGDAFHEEEALMVREGVRLDSQVLKVGHHGSRNSSSERFLRAVSPGLAVISAGEGNRFGHPHAETVERLGRYVPDSNLFVTMERGSIKVVTDGKALTVETER